MRQYIDTLQDVNGNALLGASVLVQTLAGVNASIFSDNGLTPITTSTVVTGSDGQFNFFAADGDYSLVMSKNSTVFKTQSPVSVFDGAAQVTQTDTGAVNAYATSSSVLEKALRAGLRSYVKITNTNTGASTYAYNGLAARPIVFAGGGALVPGALVATGIYALEYDGSNWQFVQTTTQSLFNAFLDQVVFTGAATDSYSDAWFRRSAAYTGGTAGHVSTCLTIQSDVSAAVSNYEWSLLALLNNSANAGQNVAMYAQGNRQTSTTSNTWAAVTEVIDNSGQANPTVGLIGLEIDCRANGGDSNSNRVPLHIVGSRPTAGGTAAVIGIGVLVDNNNDGTNTQYGIGMFFGNKGGSNCTFGVGIDLSAGSYTTGAIRLPSGAPILFDAAATNQFKYSGLGLDYTVSGTAEVRLLATGGVAVNTAGVLQQVIGPRISGYGTPTGGSHQPSFNAATITLANLAAAVAQLIIDLETHGALGT